MFLEKNKLPDDFSICFFYFPKLDKYQEQHHLLRQKASESKILLLSQSDS